MKKNRQIKKFFWAEPYDAKAIEEFLEKKAMEGLMLVKFRGRFYYFEECEPKKVRFQIDYFDKAMIFDTNPEAETRKYIDFCEECGWIHLGGEGKMQIFYTEDDSIPPIQTDSREQFRNIIKNTLVLSSIQWVFLPLIMLLNLVNSLNISLHGGVCGIAELFASGFNMLIVCVLACYILVSIFVDVRFVRFFVRNRRRVREGEDIQFYSYRNVVAYNRGMLGVFALMLVMGVVMCMAMGKAGVFIGIIFLVTIVMAILISMLTCWKKANRTFNVLVGVIGGVVLGLILVTSTMFVVVRVLFDWNSNKVVGEDGAIYFYTDDPVPVTLEMLGVDKKEYDYLYEEKIIDRSGTFLAKQVCYSDGIISMDDNDDEMPYYDINIFESNFSWINRMYREAWQKDEYYKITELEKNVAEEWNVEKVYLVKGEYVERLVMLKENKTIVLEGDFPDTKEAKDRLSELYQ